MARPQGQLPFVFTLQGRRKLFLVGGWRDPRVNCLLYLPCRVGESFSWWVDGRDPRVNCLLYLPCRVGESFSWWVDGETPGSTAFCIYLAG